MNIAIVYDFLLTEAGGSFVSALRFAKGLKERGHKVIFISSKDKNKKDVDFYEGIKSYRLDSFKLPLVAKGMFLALPNTNKIKQILRDEKIDIVHAMIPTLLNIGAINAGRSLGIKVVCHSHIQPYNMLPYLPRIMVRLFFEKVMYKYMLWVYNKSDVVIAPSEFGLNKLKKNGLRKKGYIVSNGVDANKFKITDASPFMKKYKIPMDSKKILFVGRLAPEKNVSTLIKAFRSFVDRYDNSRLIIVGSGDLLGNLKSLAKKLHILDKVLFLGQFSESEIVLAYNAADVFVLPSFVEVEPMVILEARSCGKPLIVSNSKDNPAKDGLNKNGYSFDTLNFNQLSDCLIRLFSSKNLIQRMGRASQIESRKYNFDKSIDKLENIYRELTK